MERALVLLTLSIVLVLITARSGPFRERLWIVALGLLSLAAGGWIVWSPWIDRELQTSIPGVAPNSGFVGSGTCRGCHPSEYASWHKSYHRTMTQVATPDTVLGPFEGTRLEHQGELYLLQRRGSEFWVDMKALWRLPQGDRSETALLASLPRVKQRIVMTTGSHHLQAYWFRVPEFNGMYFQFPWIYHLTDARWIPANDSFLQPSLDAPGPVVTWNDVCLDCHTVGGQPQIRLDERTMFSRVGELGIACEACHGTGREHTRLNRQPQRRYRYYFNGQTDPSIVQPKNLSHRRSSEVCGQCHSVSGPKDPRAWSLEGRSYRAGDDLETTRRMVRYSENPTDPVIVEWLRQEPDALTGRFWGDGTVRIAGREYNGLIESACFQEGELSCLSCHSLHRSDPNDQLAAAMEGNEACLQCHDTYRDTLTSHTHHLAESPGSLCYNCHMPHTTLGLFTAIRSHRIDNPSAVNSSDTGRPNACNLCHVDQTLAWTAGYLAQWYGYQERPWLREEEETAAVLLWLLKGDAAQRAIAAWALGWEAARTASGSEWQAPFLAQLLDDPYSVVRHVAGRSLRRLPGFKDLEYDFLGNSEYRMRIRQEVVNRWEGRGAIDRAATRILIDPPRTLRSDAMALLLQQRSDRPVRIIE